MMKDYNGQSYWLTFHPANLFNIHTKIPDWLCVSFGYSVDQKLVGDQDVYFDVSDGRTYIAQREFKMSLDIDFTKIPVRKSWLKVLLKQLNYIKIPFPSIVYSGDKFTGSWTGY